MKKLTVTFDNGPDPQCTPEVLDTLKARGIQATFFVCGQGNRLHPAKKANTRESLGILARAKAEGHWIGNHSLSHTIELGTTRDEQVVAREIGRNQEILGELNDRRLFRPYMAGGILSKRTFSPEAVQYLCQNDYTVVMFNCVPRDWEQPETWPEGAFQQAEQQDWTLLIVHDVDRYGGMKHLARFLDEALHRGAEIVQEFPPDCVPIERGTIVGSLDGLVCGEEAEPPLPQSTAAIASIE